MESQYNTNKMTKHEYTVATLIDELLMLQDSGYSELVIRISWDSERENTPIVCVYTDASYDQVIFRTE